MKERHEAHLLLEKHFVELKVKFTREFKFHPQRKWKFDYLLLAPGNIAVEIEGGVWIQGRHNRGQGFMDDCEKYNAAAMYGYRVLRFPTEQVLDGSAKEFLQLWNVR